MTPLRSAAGLFTTFLVVALTGSCGVDVDEAPRALQVDQTTSTAVPAPSTGQAKAVLYYVRDGTLLPDIEELPDRGLESTLEALLQASSPDLPGNGLSTSIPAGTELLGVERDSRQLTIDLSAAFDNVVGLSRQQAIGQLVLTATQVANVDSVSFQVEGEPMTVSSPTRGDRPDVDACDFRSLLATVDSAGSAGLDFDSLQVLEARRAQLDRECP